MRLASLETVELGYWLIKASTLDDQIIVVGKNTRTNRGFFKIFYHEERAHEFIESLQGEKNARNADQPAKQ